MGSGFKSGFFYVFLRIFNSCILPSPALLQTSLSKEPSKTLNASPTFDFPVSVYNLNLFGSLVYLSAFIIRGILLVFVEAFGFFFLVYVLSHDAL